MEHIDWYDSLIEILYKKFSKKSQLTTALIDLLGIDREAVYRRLRKDVAFSAQEMLNISAAWNISLDEIAKINAEQFAFQMRKMNYLDPSEEEIEFLKFITQSIAFLKTFPDTEFMDICNKLPRQLIAGYPNLNKFYLFKWLNLYDADSGTVPFSKIEISKEKLDLTEDYYKAIKFVPQSNFIFDRRIFEYLVNEINYFSSIYLITEEEKELIKNEVLSLLDYLQLVAERGCYPESEQKVNLYISQLTVDTNYSYTLSPQAHICFIHVFEKLEIYSFNTEMVSHFVSWMQMKKRTAIQISEVDARSRIEFFTKQRKLVEDL